MKEQSFWPSLEPLEIVSNRGKQHSAAMPRTGTNVIKVSKGTNIRNRYNQVPHLTQDTIGKVTNSHLDTTNESQEVSPFPAGDHKAHINRHIYFSSYWTLTHISQASFLWNIGKQCKSRLDATKRGARLGYLLFAYTEGSFKI